MPASFILPEFSSRSALSAEVHRELTGSQADPIIRKYEGRINQAAGRRSAVRKVAGYPYLFRCAAFGRVSVCKTGANTDD